MKPWVRNLVGFLSHIPLIYMCFFMGFMIWVMTHARQLDGQSDSTMSKAFVAVFICHVLIILLSLLLAGFFTVWLVKAKWISAEARVIWGISVFCLGAVTMPILYWMYLRKEPDGHYFFGAPFSDEPRA